MDNKALWNRAFTTDPRAVKPITGKQYSGNSPKPYWIIERLTEEFGPCGIGWGFVILKERFERFSDTDSLHVASVRFWYVMDGKRGELEQIGQTKSSYVSGQGKFIIDEDAPKKSVTDALVKCASYLGFAGDIFSGRWDDSKYVKEAAAEWEARRNGAQDEKKKPEKAFKTSHSPTLIAFDNLPASLKDYLTEQAPQVEKVFSDYGAQDASGYIDEMQLDEDGRAGLFHLLSSKTRSAIDGLTKGKL